MLFNSILFLLVFLPLTVMGYHLILRISGTGAQWWLITVSLVFYGYWDVSLLPVILISIGINYHIASLLIRHRAHTPLLSMGVAFNLGMLAYYKYAGFFAAVLNDLGASLTLPDIVLPLAISFFTFQQIAYLVDAHRGSITEHTLRHYTLFVVFFPQLIAGPIVHHREMMPQFHQRQHGFFNDPEVGKGLALLFVGLFQKVCIADPIAGYVDPVFANAQQATFLESWTAALGYSVQLYADFNGYCLMAMGIAWMFGIRLPLNFNSPYHARDIVDFWRRWHITLGRFLRDYLYIPLGGNRNGVPRMIMAVGITMVLGGLWHGAAWTFVLWGAMHGVLLAVNHLWRAGGIRLPRLLAHTFTLTAIVFAWVLFRANTVTDAFTLWGTMLGAKGIVLPTLYSSWLDSGLPVSIVHSSIINGLEIIVIAAIFYLAATLPNIHYYLNYLAPTRRHAMAVASIACLGVFSLNSPTTFLYFNF